MKEVCYFDYNSTSPLREGARNEMLLYLEKDFYNPASGYRGAREIKIKINRLRRDILDYLNSKRGIIIFTSGGSEANNLAIKGIFKANRNQGNHVITSSIEHKSVLETCKAIEKEGAEVTYLPVDSKGIISVQELEKSIKPNTVLITIMGINNENGIKQPLSQIGAIAKKITSIFILIMYKVFAKK